MEHKKKRGNLVIAIIILLLVLVFIYSGLRILESTVLLKSTGATQEEPAQTIVRDGVEYFPRQDITVIMLAGIDQTGPMEASNSYNNPGTADMINLLIFDHSAEVINILSLNRDTMLEIPVLGIGGKQAGSIYGQLALAHTYGSGLKDSSQNLRETVSNFLYGLDIDYYVTMNMDAIALLNDAVGGVTVNVTDDFSEVDPSITMGQVTLQGQQAVTFVRTRRGVGTQMNVTRMGRHKEYMTGFMKSLDAKLEEGTSFAVSAYQEAEPYMVTDCTSTVLVTLLERYGDYELGEVITPEGENAKGEKYMEFRVDEEKLDQLILQYLYAPKK